MDRRVPILKGTTKTIGTTRYVIGDCFNRGGMSLLYHANAVNGNAIPVIIKEWYPCPWGKNRRDSSEDEAAFKKECELGVQAIQICSSVLPVKEYEGNFAVIDQMSEDAETVQSLMERWDAEEMPQLNRLVYSLKVVSSLLSALSTLHQRLLHCDIKPGNLLWVVSEQDRTTGRNGYVKLIDFGSALKLTEGKTEMLTEAVPSTPGFRSEELKCSEGKQLTPAEDLYSAACLLFYLAGGSAEDMDDDFWYEIFEEKLTAVLDEVLPEIPLYLLEGLARLIMDALEKKFCSAAEMNAAVEALKKKAEHYEQPHAQAEQSVHVPEGYLARPEAEKQVVAALEEHRITVISGVSGSGKSSLARAAAAALGRPTIFVTLPEEYPEDDPLEEAKFELSGGELPEGKEKRDVLLESLRQQDDILVVVDNLNYASGTLDTLKRELNATGRLLVTGLLTQDKVKRICPEAEVIPLSCNQQDEADRQFCMKLFCSCADLAAETLTEQEKWDLSSLIEKLGFNVGLISMLGAQFALTGSEKTSLLRVAVKKAASLVSDAAKNDKESVAAKLMKSTAQLTDADKRVLGFLLRCGGSIPQTELCTLLGDYGIKNRENEKTVRLLKKRNLLQIGEDGSCGIHALTKLVLNNSDSGEVLVSPTSDEEVRRCAANALWLGGKISQRAFALLTLTGTGAILQEQLRLGFSGAVDRCEGVFPAVLFPEHCEAYSRSEWQQDHPVLLYLMKGPEQMALRATDGGERWFDLAAVGDMPDYSSAELVRCCLPDGYGGELQLPESFCGVPVTGIGRYAFSTCEGRGEDVRSVIISGRITEIGERAFRGCKWLREISLPYGLKHIGTECFADCRLLERAELPGSVEKLDDRAFQHCGRLESSVRGGGLCSIGEACFEDCASIPRIELKHIKRLGKRAFQRCSGLEQVSLKGELTVLEESCFAACTSLLEPKLPERLERVGEEAFRGCTAMRRIFLPDSVHIFGRSAFQSCESLTEVRMPQRAELLDRYLFYGCTQLKELRLPEGPERLDYLSFCGCTALERVTVPASVRSILFAFRGCIALRQVGYGGTEQQWKMILMPDLLPEYTQINYNG